MYANVNGLNLQAYSDWCNTTKMVAEMLWAAVGTVLPAKVRQVTQILGAPPVSALDVHLLEICPPPKEVSELLCLGSKYSV